MMEERKLPGDPQPLDEFIKRWEWRWKPRWGPPSDRELFEILSAMYRWRIQLDCGCIIERYTEGPDADTVDELAEISDSVLYSGASTFRLPPGSLDCRYESGKECPRFAGEGPVRDIVTWKHREPQIQTMQRYQLAGTWIEKRQYAIWHVALSCGHPYQETAPPDWCPEDGFPPQEAPQPLPGSRPISRRSPLGTASIGNGSARWVCPTQLRSDSAACVEMHGRWWPMSGSAGWSHPRRRRCRRRRRGRPRRSCRPACAAPRLQPCAHRSVWRKPAST